MAVYDPRSQCAHKRPFARKTDARRHAARLNTHYPGPAMRPYRCPHCGLWHVGHDPGAKYR